MTMNYEKLRIWNEALLAYCKLLSGHSSGKSEENYVNLLSV